MVLKALEHHFEKGWKLLPLPVTQHLLGSWRDCGLVGGNHDLCFPLLPCTLIDWCNLLWCLPWLSSGHCPLFLCNMGVLDYQLGVPHPQLLQKLQVPFWRRQGTLCVDMIRKRGIWVPCKISNSHSLSSRTFSSFNSASSLDRCHDN